MFMRNLPSALLSRIANGRAPPGLHRGVVLFQASDAPEPRGESSIAADENLEIPRLDLGGE
jgi:hypothetical protein